MILRARAAGGERQGVQEPLGSQWGAGPCPIKNSYVIHAFCRSRIGASIAFSEKLAIPGRPESGRRSRILEILPPFYQVFRSDVRHRDPPDCIVNSGFFGAPNHRFFDLVRRVAIGAATGEEQNLRFR